MSEEAAAEAAVFQEAVADAVLAVEAADREEALADITALEDRHITDQCITDRYIITDRIITITTIIAVFYLGHGFGDRDTVTAGQLL